MERVDVETILKQNPQIDREQLEEALAALRELEKLGIRRKGYSLVPPFSGPRLRIADDERPDPRTVSIKHSR